MQCSNRLLACLPARDYDRLSRVLEATTFEPKQTLCRAREPLDYVYFPESGLISASAVMGDGSGIEVATIGNEGMLGLMAAVGVRSSLHEIVVQVAGRGLRMRAARFAAETRRRGALHSIIALYHSAFVFQLSYSVACNARHTIPKRLCRWLLTAQDRIGGNVLPLTHDSLAGLLVVRRASIGEVLQPLEAQRIIRNGRGEIEILDRPALEAISCECYATVHQEFERLLG